MNTARIGLSNSNKTFLIDLEDYKIVNKYKWHLNNKGYAETWENGKRLFAHRLVMFSEIRRNGKNMVVDHINRDPLDNRKINLRLISRSQNNANRIFKKSQSGYRGVYYDKKFENYFVCINVQGKKIKRFPFSSPEEAARIYDELAIKYHGEAAVLNFPKK